MKWLRRILTPLAIAGALAAFGWFFVSQLSRGSGRSGEPAGVLLGPPPGYVVVRRGELAVAAAVAELAAQLQRPGAGKVGLRFKRQGAEVYWLADPAADLLEERSAGASGTRLQILWRGGLRDRLAWARSHGNFEAPGLTPGVQKNLYH